MVLSSSAVASKYKGALNLAGSKAEAASSATAKKALHVSTTQTVQFAVSLRELQGIRIPATRVKRHGVGMTGQHQTSGLILRVLLVAEGRNQIGFSIATGLEFLDINGPAIALRVGGKVVDHLSVTTVPCWIR